MPNGTDKLSALGFGTLRMPTKNGKIDYSQAEELIRKAVECGINYFDTAFMYNEAEEALGKALEKVGRQNVYIATKAPVPSIKSRETFDEIFIKQLMRLNTGWIDYYMMHNVSSYEDYSRLRDLGFWDFISQQKANGSIRHAGFSYHGNLLDFKKIIDDGPWDFCQIQYNYLDEGFQAGKAGLEYAYSKGMGVVVMEPLRGGKLSALMPEEGKQIIKSSNTGRSAAEWALSWVLSHKEVSVALSGMNELWQIEENAAVAGSSGVGCMSDSDLAVISELKKCFEKEESIPCTGCAYCMQCPNGVDIPQCFSLYNSRVMFGGFKPLEQYAFALDGFERPAARASLCVSCGACLPKCPQSIEIPTMLKAVKKEMEKPWLKYHFRITRYLSYKYYKVQVINTKQTRE